MKKLGILLTLIITSFCGYGQTIDTLYTNDYRVTADLLYGALNPQYHEGKLLNRAIDLSECSLKQLLGDYSEIHNVYSWGAMYDDIAISYFDTTVVWSSMRMAEEIHTAFYINDTIDDDELRQPFALLYHDINYIDSSFNEVNFDFLNQQFIPKNGVNEATLYSSTTLKSAALLEFYENNGYENGKLVYHEDFISSSPNIEIQKLKISIDKNRFEDFDDLNKEITYSRLQDSLLAQVAIEFQKDGLSYNDTLSFYLTMNSGFSQNSQPLARSGSPWDNVYTWKKPEMKFRVAIKYGCGNSGKIKRPIIIAPPYRPSLQPIHMNKYYNQFDFKSLLFSLTEMGYDVIFIKEKTGNKKIDVAGAVLAEFIKEINIQKQANFPNEHFETIVMGFSAGGQHARYALMKLEKEHMEEGGDHHHTRLYIPYDSPHLGANVPMFAQAVYHDHRFKLFGALAWNSLNDDASKDMLMNHFTGSNPSFNSNNHTYSLISGAASSRTNLLNQFNNSFTHAYTNLNDLRKSFPSFTRNISVSTGRNDQDYETEFGLSPGQTLFQQNITVPTVFYPGFKFRKRFLRTSNGDIQNDVFWKDDITTIAFVIPIVNRATYRVSHINSYNWDMAQGGYKNEFYDKSPGGIIPIAPVPLLRLSGAWMLGNKIYDNNMNFLPLVSAFNINPNIWSGNSDVFYDVKEEGLMFNEFNFNPITDKSDLFGYPHLGNPTNHFNITPFEAVYADPQTYEHIKMKASVMEQDLELEYLVHLRNFILDEVEADVFALQNQVIGENHVQDPNYKYRAWYKAKQEIHIGHNVTPKTNPGDYIIQATGDIRVRAGNSISLKPGFHAQAGSDFHAEIWSTLCDRPRDVKSMVLNNEKTDSEVEFVESQLFNNQFDSKEKHFIQVIPNPNEGNFQLKLNYDNPEGMVYVYSMTGSLMHTQKVLFKDNTLNLNLESGVYIVRWSNGVFTESKKMIIR